MVGLCCDTDRKAHPYRFDFYGMFCQIIIDIYRYIYIFSIMFGRPETQQEILRLCASCTKTDVALNNLVVRARISPFLCF